MAGTTYAEGQRLIALILLIAIAYSCAILSGRQSRKMGVQKYLGRLQELKRSSRDHSTFWLGLYGQLWVGAFLGVGGFGYWVNAIETE